MSNNGPWELSDREAGLWKHMLVMQSLTLTLYSKNTVTIFAVAVAIRSWEYLGWFPISSVHLGEEKLLSRSLSLFNFLPLSIFIISHNKPSLGAQRVDDDWVSCTHRIHPTPLNQHHHTVTAQRLPFPWNFCTETPITLKPTSKIDCTSTGFRILLFSFACIF